MAEARRGTKAPRAEARRGTKAPRAAARRAEAPTKAPMATARRAPKAAARRAEALRATTAARSENATTYHAWITPARKVRDECRVHVALSGGVSGGANPPDLGAPRVPSETPAQSRTGSGGAEIPSD